VGASRGRADHPGPGDGRDGALEGRPVVGQVHGRGRVALNEFQLWWEFNDYCLQAVRLAPAPHEANVDHPARLPTPI